MLTHETIDKVKFTCKGTSKAWSLRVMRIAGELYQDGKIATKGTDFDHEEARILCSLMKAKD